MRHYCTILDEGYLVRGLALHASMEEQCQPYHLWILALTGKALKALNGLALPNVSVIPLSSIETGSLRTTRTGRSQAEYAWTCKPSWMLWVLHRPAVDNVVYVDSDSRFFASPVSLFDEIKDSVLAITPHRFAPAHKTYIVNGEFNGGFVYATQSALALRCLQAWAQQCIDWCYKRHEGDKYVDQKYLNTWPETWEAHVIQHKGVNLAPWNQAGQYQYSMRGGQVYVDDNPLVWYHFHQGLKPHYRLDPFVKTRIYKPYGKALDEAENAPRSHWDSTPRITLFTIPRAFTGGDKIRQENALGSWIRLIPHPEIILFCDDPGVAEAAEQFDCVHVPDIKCNKGGIPYVSHAFHLASQLATNDILCFANADIIFIQDFVTAVSVVARNFDQPFLIVGQRWNVSVPEPLEFTDGWQRRLWDRVRQENDLRAATAIDYFVQPRGAIVDMPDFLVGSPKWDNWVVGDAEKRGLQVISATKAITCIHQRHRHVWPAVGSEYNKRLFKESSGKVGFAHSGSWVLSSGAKLRPVRGKAKAVSSRVVARPRPKHSHKPPRPARVTPRDELGLPINLNIPARELVSSAKKLRRQAKEKAPAHKKRSHSGPPERAILLAKRAKLQQVRNTIQAARIAARDARLLKRKKRKP